MNFFGYFFGSFLAGLVLEHFGFHIVFLIVAVTNGVCVQITICVMRESVNIDEKKKGKKVTIVNYL